MGLLHAWILLTVCYNKLRIYSNALKSALRADKLLQSVNNSNVTLRELLDNLMVEILSQQTNEESWRQGCAQCKEVGH